MSEQPLDCAKKIELVRLELKRQEDFNETDPKCTDSAIKRYLIAREGDVGDTVEMILKWQAWRAEFGVDNITKESVKNEVASGKAYFNDFYDKSGRACCVVRPRLHDPRVRDINECMRFGVYLLEEGIKRSEQLGKSEQVCVLYDRSGFNYRNFDLELFTTSKNLVTMLQDNYAERLGALYVIGAGWFYWMIFNIVKVFLTQRTKEKIILINNNDELLHYFDVDQLESEYLSDDSKMQLRQEKEKAESGEIDSDAQDKDEISSTS